MGWFSDKTSLTPMKEALSGAAAKVTETVSSIDIKEAAVSVKDAAISAAEKTKDASIGAYSVTKEKTVSTYAVVSDGVRNFDYAELRRAEYYKDTFTQYKDLGSTKVSEYFRSTFEVEKSTMEMVEGIRNSLPVPAQTLDDIFEQCKREAMRRAIASFALGSVMQNIDSHSAAKYENLSDSYRPSLNALGAQCLMIQTLQR